ncbi:MAG: T9SS type A sorting domain-containing protein [Crocinitomix sp.]|nr:T9SS type A sorting domain-containing protein [Crocinitomix sp.]
MKKLKKLILLPLIFVGLNTFSQDWTTCDDFTESTSFPSATYSAGELIGYSQGGSQEIICYGDDSWINYVNDGINAYANVNFQFDGSSQIAQYKMYVYDDVAYLAELSVNGSAYHTLTEAYPMTLAGVIVNVTPEAGPDVTFDYFVVTYEGVIDSISFYLGGEASITELCVKPLDETELSVVEETTNQLTAFPNPVEDMLTITSNEQLASVKIYTVTGDLVLTQSVISDQIIQLNFAELQAGFYFVVGTSLNGDEIVSKIAKN